MKLLLVGDTMPYPPIEGLDIFKIYRPIGKWLRLLRLIHHKSGILCNQKRYWLDSWKKNLQNYDQVVIFDSLLDDFPMDLLLQHPLRIKFCYRNKVSNPITHSTMTRDPNILRAKYNCKLWSYNRSDCEKYNINYYNQFHLIPAQYLTIQCPITTDVFFVGLDKGRMSLLIEIYRVLLSQQIKCDFRVISDDARKYNGEEKELLSSMMTYMDVLKNVASTRCVVDVVTEMNAGLTYRSIEATVFKKKLITNYKEIVCQDFYHPDNVFIWGQDDTAKLHDFVFSDFKETGVNVYEAYSFSNIINSIFKQNTKAT